MWNGCSYGCDSICNGDPRDWNSLSRFRRIVVITVCQRSNVGARNYRLIVKSPSLIQSCNTHQTQSGVGILTDEMKTIASIVFGPHILEYAYVCLFSVRGINVYPMTREVIHKHISYRRLACA